MTFASRRIAPFLMALSLGSHVALADDADSAARGAARKLAYSGVEAYQAGNYPAASEKLERAYRVLHAPSVGLWSARALAKVGKLVEASERYLEVTRLDIKGGDAAVQKKAQADATADLSALSSMIPSLVIDVVGAPPQEVKLTVDSAPIASELIGEPLPNNPAKHTVDAARGAEHVRADTVVNPKEQKRLELRFEARPIAALANPVVPESSPLVAPVVSASAEPAPSGGNAQRTGGYVMLGIGGAAVVTGAVVGIIAMGQRKTFDDDPACIASEHTCGPSASDAVDRYNGLRAVSSIGFVGGGVLAAAGAVLLLTARSDAQQPTAQVWIGPTSGGVRGTF